MKTIVLCNQKGGVGKSAVATLLAHYLARRGRRILAVDLDHQANFTKTLQKSGRAVDAACAASALMVTEGSGVPQQTFVLVPADQALLGLERQPALHTPFARHFRSFLARVDGDFDFCIVDTNPNPDIRVIAALASADFALSPIELNQEALDGVTGLINHDRVGLRKIKAMLNPKLSLIGLLPTKVEQTPFQKANFVQVAQKYHTLLIPLGGAAGGFAKLPARSCIAEAQASGEVLWEMKKTAARDAWQEIEPSLSRIADLVSAQTTQESGHGHDTTAAA